VKLIANGRVWVPKAELTTVQVGRIREALTIVPRQNSEFATKAPEPILLYEEDESHIGLPRSFYDRNASRNAELETSVTIGGAAGIGFRPECFKGRTDSKFKEQNEAHDAIVSKFSDAPRWSGGILQAGCAFGKTVVALRIAASLGRKTLVIVNRGFFMRQWTSRIQEFFPDAKIGYVQQNKCDFRGKDIVIGMVHSLASRRYEEDLYSAFGLVITDETHRISAPTWSQVVPSFTAKWRLGLTATPRRKDGTERVFFEHIGEVIFAAKSESMIPKVFKRATAFQPSPVVYPSGKTIPVGGLNSATLISQASADPARNRDLVDVIISAVKKGRKVFVVSERLDQLWTQSALLRKANQVHGLGATYGFATGDQYVVNDAGDRVPHPSKKGEWKTRKTTDADLDAAESCQVLFATKQMIEEGFDISALDVLIMATPIGDVEQTAGRVRRWCFPEPAKCARLCPWRAGLCQGKPEPIIVDPVDAKVGNFIGKWRYRSAFYKKIGAME
jgi:hypothetical protein